MDKSIIQLIKEGEGLTTEFKRTVDSSFKIAKTIVSFANTSGGNLLIGVADHGAVMGVHSELRELQKLEKALLKLIEPALVVQIRAENLDGRMILWVTVGESEDKPHHAMNEKGERIIYIRVKDKSMPIPRLLLYNGTDPETEKLLATRHVKTLITYLKETDSVTSKVFSKMINISEKRAERMLQDLAARQILLKLSKGKPESFSLKWTE
ncbi:MAG: ATP-binding protein [Dyadobacter sp. 50-39]|uniref:AlbA family DNA-binding domain-containing protein n=1 Tax=Dyadobacter sp. 50-39 TaxID=1895756 RepID=UPI0009614CAA|nr:ATP-binding protein [Dyadobacter sp. 50-39]OJV12797.1 MAG: ATP-binding protein [Dyadobacter sp. 50-39]